MVEVNHATAVEPALETPASSAADNLAGTAASQKPEMSRRRKRQAALKRHFPSLRDREEPLVVQEEPVQPVSPRVVLSTDRSSSTGRMTPLRRRTSTAEARRKEELVQRLAEKKQRPESSSREQPKLEPTVVSAKYLKSEIPAPQTARPDIPSNVADEKEDAPSLSRSSSRLQRWKESKKSGSLPVSKSLDSVDSAVSAPSDTAPNQATAPAADEPASPSFDMRSIVENPPAQIRAQEEGLAAAMDPTWDSSRVLFNEFEAPTNRRVEGGIDVFDAGDVLIATPDKGEEKKERDHADSPDPVPAFETAFETNFDTNFPAQDDTLDPLGWPIQQEELVSDRLVLDAEEEHDDGSDDSADDDQENLLSGGDDADYDWGPVAASKQSRIDMYETNLPDDASEAEEVESESDDDEASQINYVTQHENEEEEETSHHGSIDVLHEVVESKDAPSFHPAAAVAAPDLPPAPLPESAPVIPPPPPSSSKKKRNKTSSSAGKAIPLLAPPAEDKLKKWEESKMRPLAHLEAVKAAKLGGKPHDAQPESDEPPMFDANFDIFGEENATTSSDVKPSAIDDGEPKQAVESSSTWPQLSESRQRVRSHANSSTSPASSAAVIHDSNMADKVDFAISVASMKFEQQVDGAQANQSQKAPSGAFRSWKTSKDAAPAPSASHQDVSQGATADPSPAELVAWFVNDILCDDRLATSYGVDESHSPLEDKEFLQFLLQDNDRFKVLCDYLSDRVNNVEASVVEPFVLPDGKDRIDATLLATKFVHFVEKVAKFTGVESPFGNDTTFLSHGCAFSGTESVDTANTMQGLIFGHPPSSADQIALFGFRVGLVLGSERYCRNPAEVAVSADPPQDLDQSALTMEPLFRRYIAPEGHPSPFEASVLGDPKILLSVLGFLGDPAAVSRMKMVSKPCYNIVDDNEHRLMRDAVRLGGLSSNLRPAFWMWITLEKVPPSASGRTRSGESAHGSRVNEVAVLAETGLHGKWNHVIERDVSRAFGNLPPHKTGARLRTDSIVRALVSWGRNRTMKRGVKGAGEAPPPSVSNSVDSSDVDLTPTDTVSDWGGVSPSASFATGSIVSGGGYEKSKSKSDRVPRDRRYGGEQSTEDLALSGNALTEDMKESLQHKLSFILHALAAAHEDVGYCQGMDYLVAHLLRLLQDTIRWQAARGELPDCIQSAPRSVQVPDMSEQELSDLYVDIDRSLVVEETCFRVMDSFFQSYNLCHFYWPELRCLKTCCLVFERLIQIKLPVLADHFDHHELNVGLFALGWSRLSFLYLPSMPSATVCHMWDIWLVERSFKIFFRVATAILFLSQPILLNHELEGMMTYLNTFPDATLLNPDILIACALQIKVTNRMLEEIEQQVAASMSL